ncbi:MAG: hypothetical protein AAB868_02845 [Patescibacteria group bacterium]
MKLTKKQIDMLWGETGPYSQANLKKQVRILDDKISRVFLVVEVEINPTTFEIVEKYRDGDEFKEDIKIQQLLDHSDFRGPHFGYVSMAFEGEYLNPSVAFNAEAALKYAQDSIIKMHKFVMNNIKS